MTKAPPPTPVDPDLPVTLPPPPEPPPSQPEIPPAPPPADFPTSSEQAEANFRTTALVVWVVIGVLLLAGIGLIVAGLRSTPRASGEGFRLPGFEMPAWNLPELRMPEFRAPEISLPTIDGPGSPRAYDPNDPRNDGEGADKVENPPVNQTIREAPPVRLSEIVDTEPTGRRVNKPRQD